MSIIVYDINETCTSNALTNVWQRTMPAVVAGTTLACMFYTLHTSSDGKVCSIEI